MAEKAEPELPQKQHGSSRDLDRSTWTGPRTVYVPRSDNGFGFTLRHFIVYPPETAMDEQDEEEVDDVMLEGQQRGRRAASLEPMDTIFVKQVKEGGPAEQAGLRTGDRIVSVNGESVTGKTYSQVIALIQSSDSSLKLLVVPRDEDILQMAYQNSAYNQGQEPYKGHACEIPEPPAIQRGQKSAMAPRFKSELSVMPEEEHREVHEPLIVGTVVDHAYSAPPQAHPPTPVRSSSKNVVLSHIQNMGGHSPSSENINNYSDSSVTSSTDNQPSQNGQAAAKSRAPYLQYRPAPYTRSQTTSSLQQRGTGPGDRSTSSSTSSLPSSGRSNSLPVSHLFTSSTYVEPYTRPYEGSSYTSQQSEDLQTSLNVDSSSPSKSRWTHHSISAADPNKLGGIVTVRFHDSSGGVQQMELPRYQGSGQDRGSSVVISTGRHSISDQYGINLVSERMRKFDSADSIDSSGSSQRFQVNLGTPSDVPSMGLDSVASRIAQYESGYSDGTRSDDERFRPRRYSADDHERTRYGSPLAQARPPAELGEMTSSPPATISIYFRSDHVPSPTTKVQPSPERFLRQAHSQDRDLSVPIERISRDRSPLGLREQYFSPPYMRRTNKAASRQPSYLTAVNAPHSQGSQSQSAPPSLTVSAELDSWQPGQASSDPAAPSQGVSQNSMPEVVGSTASSTSTIIGGTTVVMRQQSTPEDREAKLFRRTSYMVATGKDSARLGGIGDVHHEMSKSDSHLLPSQYMSPTVMIEPVAVEEVHCAPPPVPPIAVPEIIEDSMDGGPPDAIKKKLSVDLSAAKQVPDESKEDAAPTTPPKASNIRKLKAFFGEKTPRIHEVTTDRSRIFDMPKPGETVKEGLLTCKMAIADGKKATDRSWKPMWVLLKGHALYLFKDKASASSSSPTGGTEEQPISIKSCMVDIAYDYTKRKNVFRLTTYNGSEYLFQTDDHDSMIGWIKAIQANNDPDEDVQNKLSKSIPSKTALRSKSPASHSPSIRQKKTSDKDHVESPKGKDGESKGNRTWKGRMAKKFKRYGSSSSAPAEAESETGDVTGTFNVHLELTPPSSFSEFIPSVVELCTKVVEERGLENQGIYRVPGNTGAVNILQEEINKDPYGQDIDCDKWLDVNVISSLLKSFFRKLPESLITDDLYDHIINANRTENPEKRMLKIKKVLHELPDHNFETFRYIAHHLKNVSDMGHVNKMYARNLAIVFGPTLVRKKDESMVSMVKDMSDQCRIVESIIVHPDWFFSSWDVDDHVPIDNDGDESAPVSGMNQELLTKAEHLELGERGKDLSAKDLVSSIISAANRKKKKKDKGIKADTIEPDVPSTGSEPSYNERNIDREIELRRVKEHLQEGSSETMMSTIKESVSSTSVVSSSSSAGSAATVVSSTNMNKQTVACNVSAQETKESSDKQGVYSAKMVLVKQKESVDSMTSSSTTSEETRSSRLPPVTKYPAYQHEGFRSYTDPKPSMHRRFSEDVLSERRGDDEVAQRFGGRTNYQAQQHMRRLQMETQQLRQREEERRAAQERLALDKRRVEMEMAKTRAELEEEEREERSKYDKADTSSITSDYSTTSSSATAHDGKPHSSTTPLSSHSDYSSNASPASLRYQDSHGYHLNSSSVTPKELQHSIRDDLELHRRSKGAPSEFDTSRVAGKGTLSRRKGPPNASVQRMIEESEDLAAVETFQRSGSYKRKGSLDSLREVYAAGERSCASSDSGDDMVKSLATAFDQKLKTYTSSPDQSQMGDCGRGVPEGSSAPSIFILPKPLPYAHSAKGDLCRFSRGDPIVGIASRFERKNSSSGSSEASSHSPHHKPNTADHTYAEHSSPAAAQRPSHQDSGMEESKPSHSWNSSDNRTGISKSEKTDANRQQQVRDAQTTDYVTALRKGSEKLYGSRERLLQDSDGDTGSKRRDPTKKRSVARRHTVGGTNDPEHFNALLSVNKSQDDSMYEHSAWDSIQPTGHRYAASPSLKAWTTEQERRRLLGSSPAIFNHFLLQSVPDHVGAGPPAKFTFESAI